MRVCQREAYRSWAERAYPKLIHYNRFDKAGTLKPANSPNSFQKKSAQGSGRCADRARQSAAQKAQRGS
jgi:hypothetical protein